VSTTATLVGPSVSPEAVRLVPGLLRTRSTDYRLDRRFFSPFYFWGGKRPVCGFVFFFAGRSVGLRLRFFFYRQRLFQDSFFFLPPRLDVFGQVPGWYLYLLTLGNRGQIKRRVHAKERENDELDLGLLF
jgi:hypothetical protein